jgi:hypothetical protein
MCRSFSWAGLPSIGPCRDKGLGSFLLIDALLRALQVANELGVRAVEVDALDDHARSFYLKHSFIPLVDIPRHLYLPFSVIRKLNV